MRGLSSVLSWVLRGTIPVVRILRGPQIDDIGVLAFRVNEAIEDKHWLRSVLNYRLP